jgi:uncharacterized protein YlxW (UPF0749 family)
MSIIPCLRTSFIALHIALASAILIQTLLFVNPLRANRQKKKEKEEEEEEALILRKSSELEVAKKNFQLLESREKKSTGQNCGQACVG